MRKLNDKGSVSIILCVAIVAILGFAAYVIDIGLIYVEKTKLTNAIDSAALAAALELPQNPTNARVVANQYLQSNNVDPGECVISISSDNKSIEIDANGTVKHIFAPIIGINSSIVNASTVAQIAPIKSITGGIRPFAVEAFNYAYGQLVTLKAGAGNGYNGNYYAVAIGGTGSSVFEANAIYGYGGTLSKGDYIDTEPGNMVGTTNDIKNYINSEQSSFSNYSRNSIRLWTIPLVNTVDVNGSKSILVVGFAEFYVEDVSGETGQIQINGRFVKLTAKGDIDMTLNDTGLYGVKLVK